MIYRGNWLAVNNYLKYRSEVDQVSDKTVRLEKTWLRHLLQWADDTPFNKIPKLRPTFPQYLLSARLDGSEDVFSQSYMDKAIGTSKRFLEWLSKYKSGYNFMRSGYLDTLKSPRLEQKRKNHEAVTLEEIITIAKAETRTLREERIQAAAVLWFLSGIRIGAFVTLPIKAVDIENRTLMLWPEYGVKTKFKKHSSVYLLDIPELIEVVSAWDIKIRQMLKPDDLWFASISPITRKIDLNYQKKGKYRSDRARKDLKNWLFRIGLEYHSPHKFRHGHAVFGLKQAETFSQYKMVSQNLGHASITTTDQIYSILSDGDVKEGLAELSNPSSSKTRERNSEMIARIAEIIEEYE